MIATPIYDQCLREWKDAHDGSRPGQGMTVAAAAAKASRQIGKLAEVMGAPRKSATTKRVMPAKKTATKRSRR